MQRRDVLRFVGGALALPFLPKSAEAALQLAEDLHRRTADAPWRTLNTEQRALVTDIAEAIIPETDTPGATRVRVPEFIDLILTEWANAEEREAFLAGLKDIDARAVALGAQRYVDLTATQKTELLTALDATRDERGAGRAFGRIKTLTIYGYFTSQEVQEKILKRRIFFDRYQGDVPFTPAV